MAKLTEDHARGHATDHEDRDISVFTVGKWVGALFATVLSVMLIVYVLYHFRPSHADPDLVLNRKMMSPALQPRPDDDMKKFLEEENEALTTYGWVDKAAGRVRIPIDRAMDLVLQKGFPVRSGR